MHHCWWKIRWVLSRECIHPSKPIFSRYHKPLCVTFSREILLSLVETSCAKMVNLRWEQSCSEVVYEAERMFLTSGNRLLLFIALPRHSSLHWSSAWLIKCMKAVFEGQPCRRLQAKASPDWLLDVGWFPQLLAGFGLLIVLHSRGW